MFKKLNIIRLLAVLLVLVGVFFVIKYTSKEDRTFRAKVLQFDPGTVTEIVTTDHQTGEEARIALEGDSWVIYSGGKEYGADIDAIHNSLALLSRLNTESIVATNSSKWEEYKVDDKQAIELVLNAGSNQVGHIFIGKFDFKQLPPVAAGRQPETKMTSYVRPSDEDKIYAVNGLLRSNFQGGKNPFRNRTVFFCNPHTDISKISINGPEGEMLLDMSTPVWMLNGMPVDSAKTDRYLQSLSRLRNSSFLDDVDVSNMQAQYTIDIEGSNFDPVSISAFPAETSGYYITSTANKESVFDGSKGGLFDKLFISSTKLLPEK